MPSRFSPALEELIRTQMASGGYASEESLLTDALAALAAEGEELSALQEGLDSLNKREPGTPVEQAFSQLRERHGLHAVR